MTKNGKHCGKRRNCTFCAISSFVTMFSKSCLLQRSRIIELHDNIYTHFAPIIKALNVGIRAQPIHRPIMPKAIMFTYSFLKNINIHV